MYVQLNPEHMYQPKGANNSLTKPKKQPARLKPRTTIFTVPKDC